MGFDWNIFRIVADLSHFASKCILIWSIHSNKSAEGVSLITQIWYMVVFCARYLPYPLLIEYPDATGFHKFWNFTLKIFYLLSSAYIILIMMRVYARTRERETAWKVGIATMASSLCVSPFVMLIFMSKALWSFRNYLWTFSIVLESVCVLPQLLLLRQTTVPTVIDSFYLVTLGAYRALYIINWIVRGARHQGVEPISIIFGSIQTLLYIDFAWVYFTRQRVKLRGGSVVDGDDLSKGWIVKRIFDRFAIGEDDEESAPLGHDGAADPRKQRWGARGISVSADDGVHEAEQGLDDPIAFEDNEDSDDDTRKPTKSSNSVAKETDEWRDVRS